MFAHFKLCLATYNLIQESKIYSSLFNLKPNLDV